MRPFFPVLIFPSVLVSLSLMIVAAAQALNVSPPRHTGPAFASAPAPFQQLWHVSTSYLALARAVIRRKYQRTLHAQLDFVDMVQLIALCSIVQGIRLWRKRSLTQQALPGTGDADHAEHKAGGSTKASSQASVGSSRLGQSDAEATDPGLLKKHSSFESYTTSFATYPAIRTFYHPHPQADKLPAKPTPLPLLVFIHGLGGSLAQFNPLLTSLVNVAPYLGIDLPGCGRSKFSPTSWDAYTPKALAELLTVVIEQYCDESEGQGAVLIGHSMGCSLSALVASTALSSEAQRKFEVLAVVGICPQVTPPSDKQLALFEKLLLVPTPIFDIWRTWDRRGGPESASVARFVGKDADIEVKKLQVRFNEQSQTAVWRRMASGLLPSRPASKSPEKGMPGIDVWASLKLPLFLIAGEGDEITKTDQIVKIGRALGRKVDRPRSGQSMEAPSPSPEKGTTSNGSVENLSKDEKRQSKASVTELTVIGNDVQSQSSVSSYSRRRQVLKTSILPFPASHGLLYDPATYRTLAGLIHTFLYEHVDTRLSLGWQLQHLSTEGKWDVKNLAKWQAVRPVSEPIAGIFRAMKTLREIDDTHSPDIFVRTWKGKIKAVVDISHESPVYDPKGLDEGGIEYHKFPTVSKIPPTSEETQDFIKQVDRLRAQTPETASQAANDKALIGVHCHYGFNRTGFFICCYLIEKEHFGVQQAIDEFAKHRPPGIRHEHFLDQLFVRYCVGLKRAPTM